jgi:hypothetical protein
LPAHLSPFVAIVDAWAGDAMALILGGSHATGADVWVTLEGRRCSLSDLDVYAVVRHRAAQRAAVARARSGRRGLRARLLAAGLAAPLEAAFLVPEDLERLPARPATLELARHGLVLKGDPTWKERVPRWDPRDVSPEEVLLLHENRAFELLLAWPALAQEGRLPRLQARHAVLKCGLDVIRVEALAQGEYPEGAEELLAWATRAGRPVLPATTRAAFRTLLEAARTWRQGCVSELEPEEGRREWRTAVSAWAAAWRSQVGSSYEDALRAARRARLRRRLRQAVFWPARSGQGPALVSRLAHLVRGTPQHRVNAAAAILLLAADEEEWTGASPRLSGGASRALATLGVVEAAQLADWMTTSRTVVLAWDRWILDGQRTEESA